MTLREEPVLFQGHDFYRFSFCFVWFYGAPTQFRSYGAETGKIITNLKQHQGTKPFHLP
jgi:hypothetical protein